MQKAPQGQTRNSTRPISQVVPTCDHRKVRPPSRGSVGGLGRTLELPPGTQSMPLKLALALALVNAGQGIVCVRTYSRPLIEHCSAPGKTDDRIALSRRLAPLATSGQQRPILQLQASGDAVVRQPILHEGAQGATQTPAVPPARSLSLLVTVRKGLF